MLGVAGADSTELIMILLLDFFRAWLTFSAINLLCRAGLSSVACLLRFPLGEGLALCLLFLCFCRSDQVSLPCSGSHYSRIAYIFQMCGLLISDDQESTVSGRFYRIYCTLIPS